MSGDVGGQRLSEAGFPASEHRNRRLDEIDQTWGMLTWIEIAEICGVDTTQGLAETDRLFEAGAPSAQYEGLFRIPGFVVDADGNLHGWVQPTCQALAALGFDGEDQVFWLTASNQHLGGATPIEVLNGTDPQRSLAVAFAIVQMKRLWG